MSVQMYTPPMLRFCKLVSQGSELKNITNTSRSVLFVSGVPMSYWSRTVPSQPTRVFQSSTGDADAVNTAAASVKNRVEESIVRGGYVSRTCLKPSHHGTAFIPDTSMITGHPVIPTYRVGQHENTAVETRMSAQLLLHGMITAAGLSRKVRLGTRQIPMNCREPTT